MSVPVFNQVANQLYQLSTLPDAGLPMYWAGYFTASKLGAIASSSTVWQDVGGFYLFLDSKPENLGEFASNLAGLLPALGPLGTVRVVWLACADLPVLHWQITPAFAKATGSGSDIAWITLRSVAFSLGEYLVSIPGLSSLSLIPDEEGGGIGFSGNGHFNGPEGGYAFSQTRISFSGPSLGTFTGELNIPVPGTPDQQEVWQSLRIGLQYAAAPVPATADAVLTPLELAYAGATRILYMPLFGPQTLPLSISLSFDPVNPLAFERTALTLATDGSIVLDSFLRTTLGYPIRLHPLPANVPIPPARFVFGYCPVQGNDSQGEQRYHLCPDGAFGLTVNPPPSGLPSQVMLGLSGLEYVSISAGDHMIVFEGNQPAFVPALSALVGAVAPAVSEALTILARTAHLNVVSASLPETGSVYFAQPQQAPLFSGQQQRADGVLGFNPMPVCSLTYQAQQRPPVFPVGVYAGLNSASVDLARELENASLAPYRRYCIGRAYEANALPGLPPARPQRRMRASNDPLGVTPQGLIAEMTPDYQSFDGLLLGNMPGTRYPSVDLTAVTGGFKQALQSNQLFFVVANADMFMQGTSVRYQLSADQIPSLLALHVPQGVIDAVFQAAGSAAQPFDTEDLFVRCIEAAAGSHLQAFLKVAGLLKLEMGGWTFQLSPRAWRTDPANPTLLIVKFCNRSLMELAQDTASWSWPEAAVSANGTLAQTQTILLDLLNGTPGEQVSAPLHHFNKNVVNDANWNGFLFLNAPVDVSELPDDLLFLTAGIDLAKFYAHHVGLSQTPFSVVNGQPEPALTAVFGLINYEDPADLYREESIAFAFKTTLLRARFANSALVDFTVEVELMLNQLLGSLLSKAQAARGNNLIIEGFLQKVGGSPQYAFALTGQNLFYANRSALTSIEVLAVRMVPGQGKSPGTVLTTFILTGNLRFIYNAAFDLFSFGPGPSPAPGQADSYLRYSGLRIDMAFALAAPNAQTFTVRETDVSFDLTASIQRPASLVNNFPLAVSALVASHDITVNGAVQKGQMPEDMGYTSVAAPLDQQPMGTSWYGIVYTLDLGTFGALTGGINFKIFILAAWSEGSQEELPVYLGLKLPGIPARAGSFPLQGVLKLGFRNFQFETYPAEGGLGYRLRLRNLALSILTWSFPPGNTDIILFGQPGNPRASLGWYAAYDEGEDKASEGTPAVTAHASTDRFTLGPVQRRLRSGRRTPPVA